MKASLLRSHFRLSVSRLSVCLSHVRLSVSRLSVCLMSVCLSHVCLSVSRLSVCLMSVCLTSVCLSHVCRSHVCLSVSRPSVCLTSVCLSHVYMYVSILVCLSHVCLSICLTFVCLSHICLSHVHLSVSRPTVCLSSVCNPSVLWVNRGLVHTTWHPGIYLRRDFLVFDENDVKILATIFARLLSRKGHENLWYSTVYISHQCPRNDMVIIAMEDQYELIDIECCHFQWPSHTSLQHWTCKRCFNTSR